MASGVGLAAGIKVEVARDADRLKRHGSCQAVYALGIVFPA
jgi:hypothetical protein